MKLYQYVGPASLEAEARANVTRLQPTNLEAIRGSSLCGQRSRVELTFIVDADGHLWLSDRRTEHVACARGCPVRGAGELVLRFDRAAVVIESVTNQSTGYCPEPSCWPEVRAALSAAGLEAPDAFTHAFEFRRCSACGTLNVLKPDFPECGCGATLPDRWNCDRGSS